MRRSSSVFFHVVSFGLLVLGPVFAAPLTTSLTTEERRNLQRETLVLIEFLQGYHYSDRPFHEVNAGELLDGYFGALDPDRSLFLNGDTEFLRRRFERNLKTVYLFKGDLHPAFEIYDVFAKRQLERCAWIDARLNRPFAFERDGVFNGERDELPRPADAKAADALWEDLLQNEIVNERAEGRSTEEAIAEVRRRYAEGLVSLADMYAPQRKRDRSNRPAMRRAKVSERQKSSRLNTASAKSRRPEVAQRR